MFGSENDIDGSRQKTNKPMITRLKIHSITANENRMLRRMRKFMSSRRYRPMVYR
ncbi:MAG: hypothetical protein BWY83_03257 [bacterium ADurb.Bin478]|nr:MAG: hypothetical protein BWY83_03257 [bacterium ADurb.Bin478]